MLVECPHIIILTIFRRCRNSQKLIKIQYYSTIRQFSNCNNQQSMFVVNFDFSSHFLPLKLLAINIPVILTEIITYPLQRLQTLLVAESRYLTGSQAREIQLILRNMVSIEGFPKLLHGMRYSVDYMGTQMTTKFLIFDFLAKATFDGQAQVDKWKVVISCFVANLASTAMAQIAFNYQTIASSLPIDKNNRPENVRIKLQKYTKVNRFPINGIKYTLPASIINTTVQLLILNQTAKYLSTSQSNISYVFTDFLTAFVIFSTTGFVSHYAFQRQVQICKELKIGSIPYSRGLLGSLLRYNVKGLTLFGLYMAYFQLKLKYQISGIYQRRVLSEIPQSYRQ